MIITTIKNLNKQYDVNYLSYPVETPLKLFENMLFDISATFSIWAFIIQMIKSFFAFDSELFHIIYV